MITYRFINKDEFYIYDQVQMNVDIASIYDLN